MRRIFMRSVFTLLALAIMTSSFAFPSAAIIIVPKAKEATKPANVLVKDVQEFKTLPPEMMKLAVNEFLSLTPSKYKKLTGHKLGLKQSLELKAAQKLVKKKFSAEGEKISKGVYILLAILGLGWLAMGILDDFSGNDWWVNLILTLLCWLPGLIHALVKMKKYYN